MLDRVQLGPFLNPVPAAGDGLAAKAQPPGDPRDVHAGSVEAAPPTLAMQEAPAVTGEAPGPDPRLKPLLERAQGMLELTPLSAKEELTPEERAKVAPWRLSSDPMTARVARHMLYRSEGDSLEQWQQLLSPRDAATMVLRELNASTCDPFGYLTPVDGGLMDKTLSAMAAEQPSPDAIAALRSVVERFTARSQRDLSDEARSQESPEQNRTWAGQAQKILDSWGVPAQPPRNEVEQMVHEAATAADPGPAVTALTEKLKDPELRPLFERNLPALIRLGREAARDGSAGNEACKHQHKRFYETLLEHYPETLSAECLREGIGPLIEGGVEGWRSTFNQFWNKKPELLGEMMSLGLGLRADFRLGSEAQDLIHGCLRRGHPATPEVRDALMSHLIFPLKDSHTGPGVMSILGTLAEMEKSQPGLLDGAVLPDASGKAAPWKAALLDRVVHDGVRGDMVLNELGGWNDGKRLYQALFPGPDEALSGPLLDALQGKDPSALDDSDRVRLSILASVPLSPEHEGRLKALLEPDFGTSRVPQKFLQRFADGYWAEALQPLGDLSARLDKGRELLDGDIARDDSWKKDWHLPLAGRRLAATIPASESKAAWLELYPRLDEQHLLEAYTCAALLARDLSLSGELLTPPREGKVCKAFDRAVEGWIKKFPEVGFEAATRWLEPLNALTDQGPTRFSAYREWEAVAPDWARALPGERADKHAVAKRLIDSPRGVEVDLAHYRKLSGMLEAREVLPAFDRLTAALNRGLGEEAAWKEALSNVVAPGAGQPGGSVDLRGGQVTVGGVRLRTRS